LEAYIWGDLAMNMAKNESSYIANDIFVISQPSHKLKLRVHVKFFYTSDTSNNVYPHWQH